MPRLKIFTAMLMAAGALLTAAALAQGSGRWTTGAPMPSARTEIAVAEVGGKIYVVGGFRGERELEVYDPSAGRWSRGTSIPRALHHAAAVGLNGKLYVIGGFVEGWTPTDEVHEYDPASDRWQSLAALPTTRGALAAAVLEPVPASRMDRLQPVEMPNAVSPSTTTVPEIRLQKLAMAKPIVNASVRSTCSADIPAPPHRDHDARCHIMLN